MTDEPLCERTARTILKAIRDRQREVMHAIMLKPDAFTMTDRLDSLDEAERIIVEAMGWRWSDLTSGGEE